MAPQLLFASAVTAFVAIVSIFTMRLLRSAPRNLTQSDLPEPTAISKRLSEALPDSVIFPHDTAAFRESTNSYWAKQECEVVPACVIRPRNDQELSIAVTILKNNYDEQKREADTSGTSRAFVRYS